MLIHLKAHRLCEEIPMKNHHAIGEATCPPQAGLC